MREHGRDSEREPAGRPAQPAVDEDETYEDGDKSSWADEASTARSASDNRRKAPHDRSGVPTTESLKE
ncbi:MAG TPA: hypothetical protein VGJ07_22410 [Rugosimonospora sp.]|jgi:hypothetical protein